MILRFYYMDVLMWNGSAGLDLIPLCDQAAPEQKAQQDTLSKLR